MRRNLAVTMFVDFCLISTDMAVFCHNLPPFPYQYLCPTTVQTCFNVVTIQSPASGPFITSLLKISHRFIHTKMRPSCWVSKRAIVISNSDIQYRIVITNGTGTIQTPWIVTDHNARTLQIRIVEISQLNILIETRSLMISSQHTSACTIQLLGNNRNKSISKSIHTSKSLHNSSDEDRCLITNKKTCFCV
jgi:hypothetical protein